MESGNDNGQQALRGDVGSMKVKRGLAQMLKGGVIMDVVTPEQALIAEEAGAVAVMALERVPADIRARRRRGPHVGSRHDPRNHGRRLHPGDGQVPHRTFRGSADPARRSASTTSTRARF